MRSLLRIHRTIGIVSSLFLILLSVSGLILHRSSELGLDQHFIGNEFLLSWYEVEEPDISQSFQQQSHSMSRIAETLYFDSTVLHGAFGELVGFVPVNLGYVAATATGQIILMTASGEVIEIFGVLHDVPTQISALGMGLDKTSDPLVKSGDSVYSFDLVNLTWSEIAPSESNSISWSVQTTLDQSISEKIRTDFSSRVLNLEQLFLDIHSGNLLGKWGQWLVDIMAILFMVMAVTGLWMWSRKRR